MIKNGDFQIDRRLLIKINFVVVGGVEMSHVLTVRMIHYHTAFCRNNKFWFVSFDLVIYYHINGIKE